MSKVFKCIVLLSLTNIATSLYSTVRPHRHLHHSHHKYNGNQTNNVHVHLNGMPLGTFGTTRSPLSQSSTAQKLYLITSNHQKPTPPRSFSDPFPPTYSRWPNSFNLRPLDFGKDWRTRAPRTFAADVPYTTTPTLTTAMAVAPTSLRPEHRFHIHSKPHVGRHVCADIRTILQPVKMDEPCGQLKLCKEIRSHYKNNIHQQRSVQTYYNCCPGWARINKHSPGCNKPICLASCKNGGKCIKPDTCKCPIGFTGKQCEIDINECISEKPCDQLCFNTNGSYYCMCRDGFALQEDKQSCKKISHHENDVGPAFEARDLENDVDIEDLGFKIGEIQKSLDVQKQSNVENSKRIISTMDVMNNLKMRMDGVEHRQLEINFIRDRLKSYELQFNKLQYTVDHLYKCRMHPSIYCP